MRTAPDTTSRPGLPVRRRGHAAVAVLVLGLLPLTACGADAPAAPAPGEASTGVPLNVGSEDPVATATAAP